MHDGYLALGDGEIVNKARTGAYVQKFLPSISIRCKDYDGLHNALGHAEYVDPATDGAPWFRSALPNTEKFYGFFPMQVAGIEDSTRTLTVTELAGDGAVQSLARHGSKEIRVRGLVFAEDAEGMSAGLAWLRSALDTQPCGDQDEINCEGRTLEFFTASPAAETEALALPLVADYGRIMYRVEPLEGPRIVAKLPSQTAVLWEVEFILNAGVPWQFTYPEPVATTTGVTSSTATETYCPPQADPYDELVIDPQQPGVSRPPRPPLIEPLQMPSSWSRYSTTIGAEFGQRHGRLVPIVGVDVGPQPLRRLRVRFYRIDNNGPCDHEGEFYITYLPANSLLTIDATQRTTLVTIAGEERPAGNLVVGSDGRPISWPSMACNSAYRFIVDSDGPLNGTTVFTDLSIRE